MAFGVHGIVHVLSRPEYTIGRHGSGCPTFTAPAFLPDPDDGERRLYHMEPAFYYCF